MTWEALSIIGTIAFAVSGALVAMEEEYDILGVLVLGLVTAFGGGIIRNLLIGVPVSTIWEQGLLLKVAIFSILIIFLLPVNWIHAGKRWLTLFDAIGLSAFAIQGALYATSMNHSISAVMVAAMMTGIGGGIIRDVLARRKPLVLRDEIYAAWAILLGLIISLGNVGYDQPVQLYLLFALGVTLRMVSVYFNWRLPRRSLRDHNRPKTKSKWRKMTTV
ncbi:trimeric intracellular cation channel family protein [Brevibacillus dissolubilis]|uniref:trimeric intracellular cation channel family protein n=1 Tax=Brevibacillus dissolubilis TaxID=1844116 RepID=UPI0020FFFFAD|nr:trimeric intracellular cation channel family protein [Brevibacillus dissolubilis]